MDAKMTALNRIYSSERVWQYVKRHFGSSEEALTRVRVALYGVPHDWPGTLRAQKRYVLRYHAVEITELCYAIKEHEALEMFRSKRRMLKYLRKVYADSRQLMHAIRAAAVRRRRYKTFAIMRDHSY